MKENQIKALIKLISSEEGDDAARLKGELASVIRAHPAKIKNILNEGPLPPAFLYNMVEEEAWDSLTGGVALFASKINPDLAEGLHLVSRFLNPTLPAVFIEKRIEELCALLRPRLLNCADYYEAAFHAGAVLFGEAGFSASSYNLRPQDIAFYSVLREKKGSPLALACIYQLALERLGIDCCIAEAAGRILLKMTPPNAAPFYIDPADNGKAISEEDCSRFINERGLGGDKAAELSSRAVIKRFLANLVYVYNKSRDERRLKFLRGYLGLLD